MACGFGTPSGRKKWGISVLLVVSAVVCWLSVGPVYIATLVGKDGDSVEGCSVCAQDFVHETLQSVDVKDIADKLREIHRRNERKYPERDDECITNKDIQQLVPDVAKLHVAEWSAECKAQCTPLLKAMPLAVGVASMIAFVGCLCALGASIALCTLCCSCQKQRPPVPPAHYGYSMPVGAMLAAGRPDEAKQPLLQGQV